MKQTIRGKILSAENSYNLPSLLTMALENRQHFVVPPPVSPEKEHLRSNCRYSIPMTCCYADLGEVSDWSCCVGNLLHPIRFLYPSSGW